MKNLIIILIFSLIGMNVLIAETTIPPISMLELEEESYVDDIPFNTKEVFEAYILSQLVLEEETYVDDIPFDTEKVLCDYINKKSYEDICIKEKKSSNPEIIVISTLDELGIDIDVEEILEDIKEAFEYSIQVIDEENVINEIKYRTIKLIYSTSTSSN